MQQQLPPPGTATADPPLWYGSVAWQVDDGWATPLRLGRPEGLSDKLRKTAHCAAGVRAELYTDASAVTVPIRGTDDSARQVVDLVVDGQLAERRHIDDSQHLTFTLPRRLSRVEIWLPHRGICQIGGPRLVDATTIAPPPHRPRWIAYGSSITQCSAAEGPSSTWPALVARRLGLDLTCFGFNGLAHLDLPVAGVIAAARPDIVTVCAGINIYNQATFTAEELSQRLQEFVAIIRSEGADDTADAIRLVLMSPTASPERESRGNAHGLTLQNVRRTVEQTAAQLPRTSTIGGLDVFGVADAELLSDGLHPSAVGYRLMADRLTEILAELLDRAVDSGTQGVLDQATTIVQQ